jgi:hypothetical protein
MSATSTVQSRAGFLVETKLHAPPIRREWVERRDLVRDLDESKARLILVEALTSGCHVLPRFCRVRVERGATTHALNIATVRIVISRFGR